VQDVSLESGFSDPVTCTPGTTFNDTSLAIPKIAIAADGSFSGTATQTGVENGALATFTYTISGHFHGLNSSGAQRLAGQIREDVTYNDGTDHTCTSGTRPVSMTRDTQGSQVVSPPTPGSYVGSAYMFRVSAGGTNIQNVTLESGFSAPVRCAPGTTFNDTSF